MFVMVMKRIKLPRPKLPMRRFILLLFLSGTMGIPTSAAPDKSDPEVNFEAFWSKFEQKYPFFETRGIDWQQQYDKFRPLVTGRTGNQQLFEILSDMVQPLEDGHVSLSKNGNKYCPGDGTLYFYREFDDDSVKDLRRVTEETLRSKGFGKTEKLGPILQYSKSDHFGYLRIIEFEGVKRSKLNKKLDQLMVSFSDCEGVIIDIRANPGGYDSFAVDIANRFTDQRRLGYIRETQQSPGKFKAPQKHYLEPVKGRAFKSPVILLTNDASASAAEVFAMSMKELPHVTIVGDRTEGIFSDMMETKLPNGWRYTLPHQVYWTPDGKCYEDIGVPADVKVINKRADLESRIDPLIITAMERLQINSGS